MFCQIIFGPRFEQYICRHLTQSRWKRSASGPNVQNRLKLLALECVWAANHTEKARITQKRRSKKLHHISSRIWEGLMETGHSVQQGTFVSAENLGGKTEK